MLKEINILMTGGHAGATAYALTQALRKNKNYKLDLYFIGAKQATEGLKYSTLEEDALPQLGISYIGITAGRLQRKFTKHTIPSLLKIPIGLFQAFWYLVKIKPDIVVSFGGFASFPVVLSAKLLAIPIIIHEQTTVFGRANKLSEKLASKIALSRESSKVHFNNKKTVVTGNPVSSEISKIFPKSKISGKPTIFITGGSRGSELINETVSKTLPKLTSQFNVIHQVGISNEYKYKNKENYQVYGRINPRDWYKFLEKADIIVSRSGANIVSEILIAKRPSILIPIPWTFMDEQLQNAKYAQKSGGVIILPQSDLNSDSLLKSINDVYKNWKEMVLNMNKFESEDLKASDRLADLIFKLI